MGGLASIQPVDEVEGFARGPYPVSGDVQLGPHQLSRVPELAHLLEQRYDFAAGELHTRFAFSTPDGSAHVEVVTFCSRTSPAVVLQEVAVTVDRPLTLVLTGSVNHEGVPGRMLERSTQTPGTDQPVCDGWMLWETRGGLSTCGTAFVTSFTGPGSVERSLERFDETAPLRTKYKVDAQPGARYVLRQMTALVASAFHSQPHRQATRQVGAARIKGWDRLREENRERWRDLWRSRILIDADDARWQELADAAFFYLHSSAHISSLFSTAMFGLAFWPNYHYYQGHVMWDIEAFAHLPLALAQPDTGRSLLEFRFQNLEAAELNAGLHGYDGTQFPWAAGPRRGEEAIRSNAPQLGFEQHVNMCVALAFARQVHITGDDDYLRERAWPVLEGVARWISSRLSPVPGGLGMKEVIGIAEAQRPVDNNAYVNMAAAVALREAAHCAERLGRGADARAWRGLADHIWLPMDGDVILSYQGFDPKRHDVAASTPEPLFALFPFGYPVSPAVEQATLRFHLDRVEPYIGHPMLCSQLGVWAARLGDRERALDLLQRGYADYINAPFSETDEFSRTRHPDRPVVGPMTANVGGFLTTLLAGFPGLRISAEDPCKWPERPVVLPAGWRSIEVERLWLRGRPARLRAEHGAERSEIRFEGGASPGPT